MISILVIYATIGFFIGILVVCYEYYAKAFNRIWHFDCHPKPKKYPRLYPYTNTPAEFFGLVLAFIIAWPFIVLIRLIFIVSQLVAKVLDKLAEQDYNNQPKYNKKDLQ